MSEEDGPLGRHVQLQALQKSQVIMFAALVEVLQKMDREFQVLFCQSLQEQIQEQLESDASDQSAHAGLLGAMCRELFREVLDQS